MKIVYRLLAAMHETKIGIRRSNLDTSFEDDK